MSDTLELGKGLQTARKRVRLSQTAVAMQLNVTRQVVSAYESGKRAVTADELKSLCNLFRVYPNDLLGFRPPRPFISVTAFRMNTGAENLSESDQREARDCWERIQYEESAGEYSKRWQQSWSKYAAFAHSPFGSIQGLTESLRADFGQEQPPVNVYLLAEKLGVFVIPTHLDKPAALVHRAENIAGKQTPPCILVNFAQPIERQRYSIGHEIAHLLLHEGESVLWHPHLYVRHFDRKEIEAEAFAAELLMPRQLVTDSLSHLGLAKDKGVDEVVFFLSHLYQVSFSAMSLRLYKLDLVSRTVYEHLREVKPSQVASKVKPAASRKLFQPESFLPSLARELALPNTATSFNGDTVRKLQGIAYTR